MSILYVIALLSFKVAIISSAAIDFGNEQPIPTEQSLAKSEYVQNYGNENVFHNNEAPTETPTEAENSLYEDNQHLGNTNTENEASTTSDVDNFEHLDESNSHSQDKDEILEPAQARYPAMVGYADNRDRFPTVA